MKVKLMLAVLLSFEIWSNNLFLEKTVEYGKAINVTCNAEGNPPVVIQWNFKSNPNAPYEKLSSELSSINNFQSVHEGFYACHVSNGIGKSISRQIFVRGTANESPKIQKPHHKNVIVSVGDDLVLNCRCELCAPIVEHRWTHNGQNKSGSLHNSNWTNHVNYSLKINSISPSESGLYICDLKNKYGIDSYSIEIKVKEPPILNNLPNQVSQNNTKKYGYVKCVKTSDLFSTVQSIGNKKEIDRNSTHMDYNRTKIGRSFNCSAFNDVFGNVSQPISFIVIGKYFFVSVLRSYFFQILLLLLR